MGIGLGRADHAGGAAHGDRVVIGTEILGQAVLLRDPDVLDAVQRADLVKLAVGELHGEAVQDGRIGIGEVACAITEGGLGLAGSVPRSRHGRNLARSGDPARAADRRES